MTTGEIIELSVTIIIALGLGLTGINQKSRISEWLFFAVVNSEKELGIKTGQLKLSMVYDWFVQKFPIVSAILPFFIFSKLVDNALERMKNSQKTNSNVAAYIKDGTVQKSKETDSNVVAISEGGIINEDNIQK